MTPSSVCFIPSDIVTKLIEMESVMNAVTVSEIQSNCEGVKEDEEDNGKDDGGDQTLTSVERTEGTQTHIHTHHLREVVAKDFHDRHCGDLAVLHRLEQQRDGMRSEGRRRRRRE